MVDAEVEQVWQTFWADLLVRDGALDIDQVKKELFDYHTVLEEVPKVYMEITQGRISKPNTHAEAVLLEFEEMLHVEVDLLLEAELQDRGLIDGKTNPTSTPQ